MSALRFPADRVLAHGANRICVRDPSSDTHCLKYELPPEQRTRVGTRQRLRRWLARRMPTLGENRTELRAWQQLQARLGDALAGFVTPCDGIVRTPEGPALRCVLVHDAGGTPARSLYAHLFESTPYTAVQLCAAVDAFEAWLLRHGIPLFDLNSGNLVVVDAPRTPCGVRLVCVDVKSILDGREIVPVSRWIPSLRDRKLRRRAERLRTRIRDRLARDRLAPPAG
ncbi:MAG: hypothetical protein KF800_08590 [Lysobacter sp.]|nr:hypothetical protein [Lysobacter sp.]